jgi:hypothetical protein
LDVEASAGQLQRQVDGNFGLTGAVVPDDRDEAIAGLDNVARIGVHTTHPASYAQKEIED